MTVYLDGMSRILHGSPERITFDRQIREWLENNGFEVVTIPANELSDPEAMARHFRRIAKYLNDDDVRNRIQNSRSWFKAPEDQEEGDSNRFVIPGENERFVKALPLIPLKIAAGSFGNPNFIHQDEYRWVRYGGSKKLTRDMFVAQVEGKSMEPEIPDGSFCLFRHGVEGSRQGKVVLVQLLGHNDPETGFRFTIKRYESSKVHDVDGTWKHVKIILKPVNPDFQNIELTGADENEVSVVAELIEVL
jgi:SOS-response transcriptional repressor LexA